MKRRDLALLDEIEKRLVKHHDKTLCGHRPVYRVLTVDFSTKTVTWEGRTVTATAEVLSVPIMTIEP